MNGKRIAGLILLVGSAVFSLAAAFSGEMSSGSWSIRPSSNPDTVIFTLKDIRAEHVLNHTSNWPVSKLSGLDYARSGRQEVNFTIAREAGRFECQGLLEEGAGAGQFRFLADPQYAQAMSALGFAGVRGEG